MYDNFYFEIRENLSLKIKRLLYKHSRRFYIS